MLRPPDPDDWRDALALIQCAHDHDERGAAIVLRYGCAPRIALALSIVAESLMRELADETGADRDGAMARLRAWADPGDANRPPGQ